MSAPHPISPFPRLLPDAAGELRKHVEVLSGCGTGSRWWSGPGFLRAMDYAEERLRAWGYGTRRQPFEVGTVAPTACWNLIADPADAEEDDRLPESLVGAHLDSVSPGASEGGPAPGADDNASGCALVLETARRLAEAGLNKRVRFALFGAEEIGIYGSRAFVNAMTRSERRALRSVWILDQAGLDTRERPTLKLEGYKTRSVRLMKRAEAAAEGAGLLTERTYRPYGSDHMPFLEAKIPTLLLIQPDDEDDPLNHTAEDTPERLDYDYMARILRLLLAQFE